MLPHPFVRASLNERADAVPCGACLQIRPLHRTSRHPVTVSGCYYHGLRDQHSRTSLWRHTGASSRIRRVPAMPEVRLGRLRRGDRVCSLVRSVIVATALSMPARQLHLRLQSVPLTRTCVTAHHPSGCYCRGSFPCVVAIRFRSRFQFPLVPSHPSGSHG